jgi:hypothetical protein
MICMVAVRLILPICVTVLVCGVRAQEVEWPATVEPATGALEWLFRNARESRVRTVAMRALVRATSAQVDAVVREVVRDGHPTWRVLVLALEKAAARGMTDLRPAVLALCGHYREEVRTAARAAAAALGHSGPVPEFADRLPASALACMAVVDQLLPEPTPPDAQWSKMKDGATVTHGWLVIDKAGGRACVSGRGVAWGVPITTVVEPASFEDYLAEVADGSSLKSFLRAFGGASQIDNEAFFATRKLVAAAWLLHRHDDAAATRLLLPDLAAADDERECFEDGYRELAEHLEASMPFVFAGTRNLARVLKMARTLSRQECRHWCNQEVAVQLADQLQRRSADYRNFRLPALSAWPAISTKLSRRERITYLIDRLLLLNSFPRDLDAKHYDDPQYLLPFSELGDTLDHAEQAVNPFTELVAMDLLPEELELLIPLLRSDDYVPWLEIPFTGHQWGSTPRLHRLRWVACALFRAAAHEGLPELPDFETDHLEERIERIADWCRRNAGKRLGR